MTNPGVSVLAAKKKPKAVVTATFTTLPINNKVSVQVTSNAKQVQVKYRTAKNKKRALNRKLKRGTATIVLPVGSQKILVRAKATSKLATSPWTPATPPAPPLTPPSTPPAPPAVTTPPPVVTPPTVAPDTTPPGPVSQLSGYHDGPTVGTFVLSWTNPTDADLESVIVHRAMGGIMSGGVLVYEGPATPGARGSFTDTGLVAGYDYTYSVQVRDANKNTSAPVAVMTTTRVESGSITGTITGPGGLPASANVDVFTPDRYVVRGSSAGADGSFTVDGLKPGQYKLMVSPDIEDYAGEWWPDAPSNVEASVITVTAGQATPVTVQLDAAGTITGLPSGPGGTALDPSTEGQARVFSLGGGLVGNGYFYATGGYQVRQLPPGQYLVRFSDLEVYQTEWWQDAATQQNATKVTVTAGQATMVSPELNVAGKITGVPSGPGGAPLDPETAGEVDVYNLAGEWVNGGYFDASTGGYAVGSLPPGDYLVRFSTYSGGYLTEWWQDAATQQEATKVTVTAGQATTVSPQLNLG